MIYQPFVNLSLPDFASFRYIFFGLIIPKVRHPKAQNPKIWMSCSGRTGLEPWVGPGGSRWRRKRCGPWMRCEILAMVLEKSGKIIMTDAWEPKTFIFRGYDTHILRAYNLHFSWFWGPKDFTKGPFIDPKNQTWRHAKRPFEKKTHLPTLRVSGAIIRFRERNCSYSIDRGFFDLHCHFTLQGRLPHRVRIFQKFELRFIGVHFHVNFGHRLRSVVNIPMIFSWF